uniref:Large ribosomal subunit protein uL5c n=1 Tax=Titanophycus setchellii TaxID=940129 RepID=A0A1G4NYC9_9FLOR|nr:Ribosomal protein L5 [Titanophycus setchellii]SCW23645.1 Ribosomal protein L5 [Titanophycus setchellii]
MNTALQDTYRAKVIPDLQQKFNYINKQQVPKLVKITINRGLGEASQNSKALEKSIEEITIISGQKPIVCKSKKAIAGFKIREDIPVGITVNLRRQKMYDFLNKLINLSLPRIRDFRGISSKNFDGRGNYNLGLREQLIFPEIEYDQIDKVRGFDISIVTTAKTDEESLALLKGLGMPFYN